LEGARAGPLNGLERVGGPGAGLDRVLHEVVQDGPLAASDRQVLPKPG
jgi:hypothetical protein